MRRAMFASFACLMCLALGACGESDRFVGVWEGKLRSSRLLASAGTPVLVQIKRTGGENRYQVKTIAKLERIPTNPVFEKVMVLSNVTAVLENGGLRFEDGSTAEIDSQTGKLHMNGAVFVKTNYDIEILRER